MKLALVYMLFFGYAALSLILVAGWTWRSLTAGRSLT